MTVLFVYGTEIKCHAGIFYHESISDAVLSRYKSIGCKLTCCMGIREVEEAEIVGLNKLSQSDFSFIFLHQSNTLKDRIYHSRLNKKIIEKAVSQSDSVIVRLPSSGGDIAVKYAHLYNKKCLVEVVGCPWDALWNHSFKGKLLAPLAFYSMKKTVKEAKHVLYVTNGFLQRRYPTNGDYIGCSDVAFPIQSKRVLEQRIGKIQKKAPLTIGTIAAYHVKYKGQSNVIKAISILRKRGIEIRYSLVGSGNYEYLKSIAYKYGVQDLIEFVGSLPHNEIFNYLDKIDIYAQPSRQEGLPRSVVEAFSRGCPVLGSKAGGIPEIVDPECIFENLSPTSIAESIVKISSKLEYYAIENYNKSSNFTSTVLDELRSSYYSTCLKS